MFFCLRHLNYLNCLDRAVAVQHQHRWLTDAPRPQYYSLPLTPWTPAPAQHTPQAVAHRAVATGHPTDCSKPEEARATEVRCGVVWCLFVVIRQSVLACCSRAKRVNQL